MVIASLGGSPNLRAYPLSRKRSCGWRSTGGLRQSALLPPRYNHNPEVDRHRRHAPRGWVTRAFTLASEAAPSGLELQAGSDLNDMCTLQLGMLYQLLARAGNNYSSMRCTVYARNFTAVGPGQVKLVRVAQFPVTPGQGDETAAQQQSTLLLHTEQSWALQGGSAAVDPSAMIEDCLLHREVVALPSSSALVFPLVDCAVLVGLLVVELETERERDGAIVAQGGTEAGAAETSISGNGPAGAYTGAAPQLAALCTKRSEDGSLENAAATSAGGRVPGPILLQPHSRPRRSLTEEELQCLRLSVPLLSKACGMDARASWQLAQSSVGTAAARGLLREAQRPLSTLNTFSTMLIPRLKDGDPDKDMAKGILLQGKRLQDLMWQLEDALHGPQAPGLGVGHGGVPSDFPLGLAGGMGQVPLTAPPFRTPSALPRDPSPAVQELLQLPQPRMPALPPGLPQPPQPAASAALAGASEQLASEAASVATAAGEDGSPGAAKAAGGVGRAPVHPGAVTFVERVSSESTTSIGDSGTGAFTIRQPPVAGSGRPGTTPSLGPNIRHASRPYQASATHPAGPAAATATIDVEMDTHDSRRAGLGPESIVSAVVPARQPLCNTAAVSAPSAFETTPSSSSSATLALAATTNLATALSGVLTAACKLAAVSGIGFIVNSPLSAVLPRRGSGSRPKSSGNQQSTLQPSQLQAAAAAATGRDLELCSQPAEKPHLIPRPARPLLVGVRVALVQKVVGYMLDIALQCTPRGGQVCVSARQDGAGVQVQVLHSGRMDLHRLHARSHSLAVHSVPAPQPVQAASGGAAAAAALATKGATQGRGAAGGVAAAATIASQAGPVGAAARGAGPSLGGGYQAGSGVLSVEMAQELAHQAGGYLTVSYPFNMVNAQSGNLDVGTNVEIWLPGPSGAN